MVIQEDASNSFHRRNRFLHTVFAVSLRATTVKAQRLLKLLVGASEIRITQDASRFRDGSVLSVGTYLFDSAISHLVPEVISSEDTIDAVRKDISSFFVISFKCTIGDLANRTELVPFRLVEQVFELIDRRPSAIRHSAVRQDARYSIHCAGTPWTSAAITFFVTCCSRWSANPPIVSCPKLSSAHGHWIVPAAKTGAPLFAT
jgi:hypothetical protein